MRKCVFRSIVETSADTHTHTTTGAAKTDVVAFTDKVTIPANTVKAGDQIILAYQVNFGTVTGSPTAKCWYGFTLTGLTLSTAEYKSSVTSNTTVAGTFRIDVLDASASGSLSRYEFANSGFDVTVRDGVDYTHTVYAAATHCWETGTVAATSVATNGLIVVEVWRDVSEWDETTASHATAGSFGLATGDIAAAVWNEPLAGHLDPGTAAEALFGLFGLLQNNVRMIETAWTTGNKPTAGSIFIYASAAACDADSAPWTGWVMRWDWETTQSGERTLTYKSVNVT